MTANLFELSLVEAAAGVAARELSPVELTQACLDQIERRADLNAFSVVMAEQAMADALRLEAEAAKGAIRGSLHGVPLAVKDLCDVAGVPTAAGIPAFRHSVAQADSTVVRRLREAGAVILGKTELAEGALAFHHPDVTAPVNPWKSDLWPGTSSSGSGVAVGTGQCFGAIGTDTGGSIRFPSLCNGVIGIKPTWGRVSRKGVFPLSWTLDHVGPMARSVEDAATMLSVISGRDEADPTSLAAPVSDVLAQLGAGLRGLRLGLDEAYAFDGVLRETASAMSRAVEAMIEDGASLQAIKMPHTVDANAAWIPICLSEAACVHSVFPPEIQKEYGPSLRDFLLAGSTVTGVEYARANLARRQFAENLNSVFRSVDIMIVPVIAGEVPTIEEYAKICPDPAGLARLVHFTCLYDVSGHPTITIPAGFSDAGNPIAFQLVAGLGGEETLCRAAFACQTAFG